MQSIITHKMIFGGKTLGNLNGKTVFVPFSLPGEELEIEITKSSRDYDEAKIVEITKPSPHRVQPKCPLYGKCGGCNMMHIDSAYQIELKKQIMSDVFAHAGIDLPPLKVIAKNPFGYRNRVELHAGGFEERGTNNVIPVQECPIAAPQINEWLKSTPQNSRPRGKTMLFGSQNAQPKLTVVELSGDRGKDTGDREKARGKNLTPSHFTLNPVALTLCGKKILFDAKVFFQSNVEVLEEAIPQIMNEIRQATGNRQQTDLPLNPYHLPLSKSAALDLYSGSGTFSVFLADIFQNVAMVEHNKGAVVFAEQNMVGKPHSSYAVSGANFIKYNVSDLVKHNGNFDMVFADPPRSGMEKEVLDWLCKSGVGQIGYLSCDIATQARDVAKLVQNGYTLECAYLLDFYPQTSHLETFLGCIKK